MGLVFFFPTCSCSSFLSEIKYQEKRRKAGEDAKFVYEKKWLSILLHLKGMEKERMRIYSRKTKLA